MSIPTPIWLLTSTLLITACSLVNNHYELAERDIVFQRFDRAISTLNELSLSDPKNLKTHRLLARALRARGDERSSKDVVPSLCRFRVGTDSLSKVLKLNYQLMSIAFAPKASPYPISSSSVLCPRRCPNEMVSARFRQAMDENERPKAELLGRTVLTKQPTIDDLKWLAQQASSSKSGRVHATGLRN